MRISNDFFQLSISISNFNLTEFNFDFTEEQYNDARYTESFNAD